MTDDKSTNPGLNQEKELWDSDIICACQVDGEGSVIKSSKGFRALSSNSSRLASLIHPEDRSLFMDQISRVSSQGMFMERQPVRFVTPDGKILLVEVSAQPWRHDSDQGGAMVSWWERTGDVAAGWEEAEEHEGFIDMVKNFVESLGDPVVLLSTGGRIIHVNQAFHDVLGFRRSEIIGDPVGVLFEPRKERMQQAMMRFAQAMKTGKMHDVAMKWISRQGAKVPVTMSGSVIRSATGELAGMVVVGRDERENAFLKDLEVKNRELKKAYEDLKRLDEMKDEVLSLVGHELRAPLANILGYAEFLLEWDITEHERLDYLRIIYQESQHLRRLVNDILDITRMEAGRMRYSYISSSLSQAVHAAVSSVMADVENKNINLTLNLDDQLEPIEFDPDRIQQVITNIVYNAMKFTPPGKSIHVTTGPVEGGQRVSIRDEGIGIETGQGEKVFQKFGQIMDVKHHSEGAGLGMPIAKLIVEEGHKGKMWFESEGTDKGTTFWFTLPEKREED